MSGRAKQLFNMEFQRLTDGPLLAYVTSGRIALRRKRALWVARCMAVARRRQLKRQMKEGQHGRN